MSSPIYVPFLIAQENHLYPKGTWHYKMYLLPENNNIVSKHNAI